MSITDLITQRYLKETYTGGEVEGILEPVPYEVIQKDSIYKVDGNYIKFFPVKDEEIYSFSLSTEDEENELGTVYKIQDGVWKARAKDIPDIEGTGNDMLQAALIVISAIGEI